MCKDSQLGIVTATMTHCCYCHITIRPQQQQQQTMSYSCIMHFLKRQAPQKILCKIRMRVYEEVFTLYLQSMSLHKKQQIHPKFRAQSVPKKLYYLILEVCHKFTNKENFGTLGNPIPGIYRHMQRCGIENCKFEERNEIIILTAAGSGQKD